jgi:hypothetical protein
MTLNEFTRGIEIWRSQEEREVLSKIKELTPISAFKEREQTIIESLVRKSLLIKIKSKENTYVYPNV